MPDPQTFTISYDGEALREGRMDVRELAPALLAAGDLFQGANRILNEGRSSVSVQVQGQFRTGSFPVVFAVDQSPLAVIPKLIRWLKGDRPKEGQVTFTNNGTVIIALGDRSTETSVDVYRLATDRAVRGALEGMVSPLRRDGVDTLDLYRQGADQPDEAITKDDIAYFSAEELEGETLLDNTRQAVLSIIRLSFKEEHKWGFTDGTTRISARILDPRFWQEIRNGRPFSKGDHILVSIRTRTFRRENGELKSEYFIEQVHRLIHRPEPQPFELAE